MPERHFVAAWQPEAACPRDLVADRENGDVHLWRISIDEHRSPTVLEERRRLLSPDELERADRFKFDKHRHRFVLGRAALRTILGRYLDRAPAALAFDYEAHGKPALAAGPGEPLSFNVSHSGTLALVAVTRAARLGVDIEQPRVMKDRDALVERFFSVAEGGAYRALSPGDRPAGFLRCWTRKEAFIKAIGEGLSRPLHAFEVTLDAEERPRLLRVDGHPGEERRWALYSFEPAPEDIAALIVERRENRLSFFDFEGP